MISAQSPIVVTGVRVVSPLALMLAAFLFFAGHNQPGGGFAAGLVLGSVVSLRMLAGLHPPSGAVTLLAVGGVICSAVAVFPMLGGNLLLDQFVSEGEFPVLGKVKGGSALAFDLGVTLIVVGLIIAVLEGLGAVKGGLDLVRLPDADESQTLENAATSENAATPVNDANDAARADR